MADAPVGGREEKTIELVQTRDPSSTEFSQRGDKGLDSPEGARLAPEVTPGSTTAQDAPAPPDGNVTPATSQQDQAGAVDYDG
jgi:hypothetical protein